MSIRRRHTFLGQYLISIDRAVAREILDRLTASKNVWERRIAIVSTFAFMKAGEIQDVHRTAGKLLQDKHDLIHKSVGWALRESGKISRPALLRFLEEHYSQMPRTGLRYAIEHFPVQQRKKILAGNFL
ncbi:MAG: DNA alkylation repair protein [Bryobacteraceae bacterium]